MVAMAPSKTYPYQDKAVEFLQERGGCAGLFMEMGTGKTRVALTYCELEDFKKVLIVCPISVAGVWAREIRKLEMDVEVWDLTFGTIPKRSEFFQSDITEKATKPIYFIVNYEAYWRMPLRMSIQRWRPDCVILDEAHRIKGRTTRQAKFAHALTAIVPHRLALTGTPITNGMQDLFSIYKFIDPFVFGTRYLDFENHYITKGGFQGYQIIGYRNLQEAQDKVKQTAYQISKAEALDLPERTDTVLPVKLDPKTAAKYREFKKHAIAEIEGKDENGRPIRGIALARIVLTTILRLQQIVNGFVTTDTGDVIIISNEKLRTCEELVQSAMEEGRQVVVFCRFLKDIDRLSAVLPNARAIHGSVAPEERAIRLQSFQDGNIRVLICQISVASLGIDLTASNIGIFYSTGFSLTDFLQSRDRLHRHGQTRKVSYYHLLGENSVDFKVYDALQNKVNLASKVVSLDYTRKLLS